MHLKTLGHPALRRADGSLVEGLRRKDLALLVYLCVQAVPVHARGRLAALLWGSSREARARHSLTQALGRLVRVLPPGVVSPEKESVRWAGGLPWDAEALLRGRVQPDEVDDAFALYAGPFLEGFDAGTGAEEFGDWADRCRWEVRNAALRLLERAGEQAEAAGDWGRALRLAERAVAIDSMWEQGHRRLLRALASRGERNRALRHYQTFEAWLAQEVGGEPDPDTRALAEQLRAPDPQEPPPQSPPPAPDPLPEANTGSAVDAPPASPPESQPAPTTGDGTDSPPERGFEPEPQPEPLRTGGSDPVPFPAAADADDPLHPPVPARRKYGLHGLAGPHGRVVWLMAGVLVLLLGIGVRERTAALRTGAELPAHGESVRLRGGGQVYLAFGEKLYEYPDSATLCVCTGWRPEVVRRVRALPPWPRARMPSVLRHGWIGSALPVVSDHPQDKTAYVAVGCVLPGVPDPQTLDSIFGSGALGRMLEVPDSVLRQLPRAFIARGHPLRPSGTLIRGPDDRIRWITYHGGALEVEDPRVLATHCRSPDEAVSVSAREFRYYKPWARLQPGTGRCGEDG